MTDLTNPLLSRREDGKVASAEQLRSLGDDTLESGVMRTADIVFFVLAGVAPMGAVVALVTLAIAFGNGAGVPARMSWPA